jgi:DNA-binding NarL/FixJ family response regulator
MKFLLIDDHVLIREALRGVLKELRRDAAVLEAANCQQAKRLVEEHADLEVILLDLNLPDGDGFRLLAQLREHHPDMSIIVLSASNDRDNVVRALDLGAVGFIPKSAQRAVMVGALELVLSGGIYIPPEILARDGLSLASSAAKQVATDRLRVSPADCGLTERQIEVLALMMQGKSNKAICSVLALAEPTVKNHVAAILKALKVKNRTEAAMAVVEHGWDLRRVEK